MSKATWRPEEQAWLDAHPGEGLPPDPYWHNGKREIGPRSPWVPLPPTPEERAALLAEGTAISQREGQREATLLALGQIARVGTGR